MLKREMRVLGIDDVPFDKYRDKKSKIIGVFYRGGNYLDGVLSREVTVDGTDATKAIISMATKSKFAPQLQAILIDGIAVAGLNVIDIHAVHNKTKLPVIVVIRKKSDKSRMKSLLKRLKMQEKIALLDKAGTIYKGNKVYFQIAGVSEESAKKILRITTSHSHLPEPVRVAHIIASGVTLGESRGKP